MTRYNSKIVDALCQRIAEGETVQSACRGEHLHRASFYQWLKSKPEFAERVNAAHQEAYERLGEVANQSIYRLLTGYDVTEERTVTVDTGRTDENGKKILRVKEHITTKKHIPPSAAAIIFTLCNRDPEHWKNRQIAEVTGREGRGLFEGLSDEELNERIPSLKKKLGG